MADYTTADDLDLVTISAAYGVEDPAPLEPVPGGAANSSFRLRGTRDGAEVDYALTVLDNNPGSADRLTLLLEGLAGPVGQPELFDTTRLVRARGGERVVTIAGRVMIVKQWVRGRVHGVLPAEYLGRAGVALARLHSLSVPAVVGDHRLPSDGRRLTAEQRSHTTEFGDRSFAEWLDIRLATLDGVGSGRPDVVIHGDLYSDNIIVSDQDDLVVIDWETACLEDPLLDLGMAVLGLGVVDGCLVPSRMDAIVEGYSSVLPLTVAERTGVLLDMVELSALIIAFHRYYRHNVRFPGSPAADRYREMVGVVESLPGRAGGRTPAPDHALHP
ncbi:phosphotransferase [Nocardia sp. NPDC050718]|uniref:phosphotransferase n=1 Tax=Nocardia sp. NPDC050718 TaxID=3155788 RepID=UPI0034003FCC